MKKLLLLALVFIILFSSNAFAYRSGSSPSTDGKHTQDDYGHWTNNKNLDKDTDGDGVTNRHDSNDRNPYKH